VAQVLKRAARQNSGFSGRRIGVYTDGNGHSALEYRGEKGNAVFRSG
jgi:hypothetical protein